MYFHEYNSILGFLNRFSWKNQNQNWLWIESATETLKHRHTNCFLEFESSDIIGRFIHYQILTLFQMRSDITGSRHADCFNGICLSTKMYHYSIKNAARINRNNVDESNRCGAHYHIKKHSIYKFRWFAIDW